MDTDVAFSSKLDTFQSFEDSGSCRAGGLTDETLEATYSTTTRK